MGYSLYDTIIVFDRIRENVPRMPRATFSQIANRSMSEVLTRSLATSFTVLMPVGALMLFGGETLKDFAFALLVGVASGAYSSIFIATPVLVEWKEREQVYMRRRRLVQRAARRAGAGVRHRRAREPRRPSARPRTPRRAPERTSRARACGGAAERPAVTGAHRRDHGAASAPGGQPPPAPSRGRRRRRPQPPPAASRAASADRPSRRREPRARPPESAPAPPEPAASRTTSTAGAGARSASRSRSASVRARSMGGASR